MSASSVAADLVLLNANVLTIDAARPRAQAVAIGGGRILAVGSNDDVRGWMSGGAVVRDLAGQTLLPGFYDSHNHMLLTGLNLIAVDLSDARSVADVVQRIGQRAASTPPGQWVLSSARWHESQLAEREQPVGGGSDSPVTSYQPLLGIWSSVTRQTHGAGVQGPEWKISAEEALRMYTLGSAYAAFEEDQKGSITPGKHADLVVLDADPCAVEPEAIRDIRVVLTVVDGEPVFES